MIADTICFQLTFHFICMACVHSALSNDVPNYLKNNDTILSRQRRYLVFPEGSAFQVIFDLTYPSVAIEGNVFVFGHTAAMAWELPSTPIFLNKKHLQQIKKEENAKQTMWKPSQELSERPHLPNHSRHPVFNYSTNPSQDYFNDYYNLHESAYTNRRNNIIYKNAYDHQSSNIWKRESSGRSFFKLGRETLFDKVNRTMAHHIQRRSRRELYRKVEKLLSALSKDGKTCILKAICQVSKLTSQKGSMWAEIIKVIFRAKNDNHLDEDHYDRAFKSHHDCEKLYPNCEGHVLSHLFRDKIKIKST